MATQETTAPNTTAHDEAQDDGHAIPHLPDPSIWPLVLSIGITLILLGVALGLLIFLSGIVIFFFGLGGWVYQDIQVAKRGEHH